MAPHPKVIGEGKPRCTVSRIHNGIEYRCIKHVGHENEPGNEECEAQAPEYMYKTPDWRSIAEASRPVLEWVAENPEIVGAPRAEAARRVLVRMYISSSPRPGPAKTS